MNDPNAGLLEALRAIANGRMDNGKPHPAYTAQQLARSALINAGMEWSPRTLARMEREKHDANV